MTPREALDLVRSRNHPGSHVPPSEHDRWLAGLLVKAAHEARVDELWRMAKERCGHCEDLPGRCICPVCNKCFAQDERRRIAELEAQG